MFAKGDLVVCVNSNPDFDHDIPGVDRVPDMNGLRCGVVYTVRANGPCVMDGSPCVWLEEIVRPIEFAETSEVGYLSDRFRPVQRKSMEVFTGIPVNELVE